MNGVAVIGNGDADWDLKGLNAGTVYAAIDGLRNMYDVQLISANIADFVPRNQNQICITRGPTTAEVDGIVAALPQAEKPFATVKQLILIFKRLDVFDECITICAGITIGGGGKHNYVKQVWRYANSPKFDKLEGMLWSTIWDSMKHTLAVLDGASGFSTAFQN